MLPFIAAAVCMHTPNHFLESTCGHSGLSISEISVSQVHYIHVDPLCNVTLSVQEKCNFNKISLHRFTTEHKSDAFVLIHTVDGTKHLLSENKTVKDAEPFTTTHYVTTMERDNFNTGAKSCNITVGARSKTKLSFVVGKSEEWWLFLTIPYYAPRIQWGWAFATMSVWYWPFLVILPTYAYCGWNLATKYGTTDDDSLLYVVALIALSAIIDFVIPVSLVVKKLGTHWPTSGLWNIFVVFKILRYAEFVYLFLKIENSDDAFEKLDKWRWKLWKVSGIDRFVDGPRETRTRIAPVSIWARAYGLDLIIWIMQLAVLCVTLSMSIALSFYLLFIVLLFRNWCFRNDRINSATEELVEFSKRKRETGFKSSASDSSGGGDGDTSVLWACGIAIQGAFYWILNFATGSFASFALRFPLVASIVNWLIRLPVGIGLMFIFYSIFPLYFACRTCDTLAARAQRLLPWGNTPRLPEEEEEEDGVTSTNGSYKQLKLQPRLLVTENSLRLSAFKLNSV